MAEKLWFPNQAHWLHHPRFLNDYLLPKYRQEHVELIDFAGDHENCLLPEFPFEGEEMQEFLVNFLQLWFNAELTVSPFPPFLLPMAFRWSRLAGAARRLAVPAVVTASVAPYERRPLQFETRSSQSSQSLEERVRVLETKVRAMELNDLEEVRDLTLVWVRGSRDSEWIERGLGFEFLLLSCLVQ